MNYLRLYIFRNFPHTPFPPLTFSLFLLLPSPNTIFYLTRIPSSHPLLIPHDFPHFHTLSPYPSSSPLPLPSPPCSLYPCLPSVKSKSRSPSQFSFSLFRSLSPIFYFPTFSIFYSFSISTTTPLPPPPTFPNHFVSSLTNNSSIKNTPKYFKKPSPAPTSFVPTRSLHPKFDPNYSTPFYAGKKLVFYTKLNA